MSRKEEGQELDEGEGGKETTPCTSLFDRIVRGFGR